MGTIEQLMHDLKTKEEWKRIIKLHQNRYWYNTCTTDQAEKSSLQYLQIQDNPLTRPHNIWKSVGNDPVSIRAGEIKTKIATQTYMLQSLRAKYTKNCSSKCVLCKSADEDLQHFLLECSNLTGTRHRHLQKIQKYLNTIKKGLYQDINENNQLVQLIVDCTNKEIEYGTRMKPKYYIEIENLTRTFCYDLHVSRTKGIHETQESQEQY